MGGNPPENGGDNGGGCNHQLDAGQLDHDHFNGCDRVFHRGFHRASGAAVTGKGRVMEVINTRLMAHPLNWITVFLMVFIAGIAVHFILMATGMVPAAAQSS